VLFFGVFLLFCGVVSFFFCFFGGWVFVAYFGVGLVFLFVLFVCGVLVFGFLGGFFGCFGCFFGFVFLGFLLEIG